MYVVFDIMVDVFDKQANFWLWQIHTHFLNLVKVVIQFLAHSESICFVQGVRHDDELEHIAMLTVPINHSFDRLVTILYVLHFKAILVALKERL